MEKLKVLPAKEGSKIVCLIGVVKNAPWLSMPKQGEYDNPYICKVIPCIQIGERFENLRTGKAVVKGERDLVWLNLVGTMFRYEDGYELLVSRTMTSERRIVIHEGVPFNPATMVRYNAFEHV